jgi:hypothetical protein
MAELPLDQAVPRFKANEDRLDTFVNSATGYTTSGGTSVQSIQQFLASIGSNGIDFVDNAKARFGTGNDLEIYHSGSGSFIRDTGTGDLTIDGSAISIQTASAERISVSASGINVTGTVEFDGLSGTGSVTITDIADEDNMASNSATKLATQQSIKAYVDAQVGSADTLSEVLGLGNTTGGTDIAVSANDDITFADNSKAIFGAGSDLKIFHDGSNSYINEIGAGDLVLQTNGAKIGLASASPFEWLLEAVPNDAVTLYYDGSAKLATTSSGIDVTGNVVVSGTVDGRDVATDGTKLDGISTGADVTLDEISAGTNVSISAGGVISATASGGITNVVDDTSPSLGGNLSLNSHDITGTGNIDIAGTVEFDGLSGTGSVTVTDILDEDNMASNSATKLATQQSIKSYVDTQVATIPTGDITSVVAGTGLTGGGTSGAVTLNVSTLNQNTTGNAATATALQTARTIAGVSFNGTANIALNNNAITNGAGYTTNTGDITGVTAGTGLTGGGTSGTVTLNVSQGAGSGLDADTCDGLHVGTGRNNTANQIVRTDGSGYSQLGWINTTSGATSTTITRMYMGDNDGYIRYMSPANFFNQQASALLTAVKTVDGSGSGLDADTLDGVNGASYLRSDTTDYMNANLVFADNARLQIGTNTDLQLFHDGNDSYIREAGTGVLFMDSDDIHFRNGAGSNTLMQLSSDVLTMQGQLQMNGNIINDVEDIYLRDRIFHDADTDNWFQFGTDSQSFVTGGTTAVTINNNDLVCYRNLAMSGQIIDNVNHIYLGDRIFHHGDTDNYKQFTTDTQNFVTGGSTRLRLNNTGAIIYQDLYTPNKIIHSGDTDTYTQFHASNQWRVVAAGNERFEVRTDGVLVSTTLTATGDVIAYGSSDKQLKDNIKPIANAMDKISKLSGNTFDWNDKQSEYHVGTKDVGVIAQEVEAVLPEVVTTRDNGYKAVRYEKMIALLIEGMKEQQAEIDTLKAKLGDM